MHSVHRGQDTFLPLGKCKVAEALEFFVCDNDTKHSDACVKDPRSQFYITTNKQLDPGVCVKGINWL